MTAAEARAAVQEAKGKIKDLLHRGYAPMVWGWRVPEETRETVISLIKEKYGVYGDFGDVYVDIPEVVGNEVAGVYTFVFKQVPSLARVFLKKLEEEEERAKRGTFINHIIWTHEGLTPLIMWYLWEGGHSGED